MTFFISGTVNDTGPSPDPTITVDLQVNGSSLATFPKVVTPFAWFHTESYPSPFSVDVIMAVTISAGRTYNSSVIIKENLKTLKYCPLDLVTSNHTVECSFGVGRQVGPPTYLEELHKLDNYSKAQYIPDRHKWPGI